MPLPRQPDRMWDPGFAAAAEAPPALALAHATWQDHHHGRVAAIERRPHAHDVYHIVTYVSGRGTFVAPEGPVAVAAPYLVLTAPGQLHCFTGGPGEDAVYSELTFVGREAGGEVLRRPWSRLLSGIFGGSCAIPVHGPVSEALVLGLDRGIADLTALGHAGHAQAEGHARVAILQALTLVWQHLAAPVGEAVDAVTRARAILDERLEDPPSLTDLAAAVGLTPKALIRGFAARYGDPPGRYRQRALMQRASELLKSTNFTIGELADRLGFPDPRYFIRCFKKATGVTPLRYRRMRRS